ncbi:hypothetical protein [Chamaesiphon sp.]
MTIAIVTEDRPLVGMGYKCDLRADPSQLYQSIPTVVDRLN